MDEFKIVEYQQQDRNQCIDLLKSAFPGSSDENTFAWRFEMQREIKPILLCAKYQDKIVAFVSLIPWKFVYKGDVYWGYQSGEVATDITYRGKGILTHLLKYADTIVSEMGIDFLFGFPSVMSYAGAYLSGYIPVATYYFSLRPICHLLPYTKSINKYVKNIPEKIMQHDKITPIVDDEYVQWRYHSNPKSYDIIKYSENNSEMVCYFRSRIWRCIPEIIMLDCQCTTFNKPFIDNAFRDIVNKYAKKALYIRTFFNERSDRGEFLKRMYPITIRSKNCLYVVKNISGRISSNILYNLNNWDIQPHMVDDL